MDDQQALAEVGPVPKKKRDQKEQRDSLRKGREALRIKMLQRKAHEGDEQSRDRLDAINRGRRVRLLTQAEIRAGIDAPMLSKRLNDHVVGQIEMSSSQVKAACYLLDKVVSNAPVEISVDSDGAGALLADALEAARLRMAKLVR